MTQANHEIVTLKENMLQCMRRGVKSLASDALNAGVFRPYGDNSELDVSAIQQGSGAWTTAEGILAILYTDPWFHDSKSVPDTDLLSRATYSLLNIKRNYREEGIPADPDLGISHRGVVDSTVKVVMALTSVKRYMISRGWHELATRDNKLQVSLDHVDTCIDALSYWLKRNQNNDGSWGLWQGEEGRSYPTYYAIKALMDCGEKGESDCITRASRWFKKNQNEDGGWGFSQSDRDSDIASTSFAVLALSHVEPL